MAMEQIGYVTEVSETEVTIQVPRKSACGGNCAGCHGCPSGSVCITHPNDSAVPFVIGEEVVLEMPAGSFLRGTFGSYGLLSLCLLLGAILGYVLTGQESGSVLGAFLALGLGVLCMQILFRRHRSKITVKRQMTERKR